MTDSTTINPTAATNLDQNNLSTTTTLFISGLPQDYTSDQLLTLASTLGPVRNAFVVNHKPSSSTSTNSIGYVRYVLRTDAESALQSGLDLIPRPILSWAKPKPTAKERRQARLEPDQSDLTKTPTPIKPIPIKKERLPNTRKPSSTQNSFKKDPSASRTVVVQGLPLPLPDDQVDHLQTQEPQADHDTSNLTSAVMTKALYKRGRKLGSLESVIYPAPIPHPLTNSNQTTASAHLCFSDPTIASRAAARLHLHIFKGHLLTTVNKARLMANSRLGPAHAGGRLIVRNLDFNITESDLRLLFGRLGPIQSVELPIGDQGKGRGFGFVWMVALADAERAMKALNGTRVYAGMAAEAIAADRSGEKKSTKRKREKDEQASKPKSGEVDGERGRVMAVDWALGKKQFVAAEQEEERVAAAAASKAEASGSEEQASDDDDEEDEDDADDGDEDEDDEDEDDDDDVSEGDSEPTDSDQEQSEKASEGVTLFIRNLSFEATEDELHSLFRAFGSLRYARIVMDPKTSRSRGTGFVCMWNRADAKKVLELATRLESEGSGQGPLAANGLPSLLQPDPSSSLATQLSLHGRVLGVSEAVSKTEAERLRVERDRSGAGKDKRNLYLMKEGLVLANTKEASKFEAADLAARQASFDERKALLRTNLSLYISRTRLSVRQIPTFVTDRTLKRLARHALTSWRQEVRAGTRPDLAPDEKICSAPVLDTKAGRVRQAKVVRDDANGKKSKGYGFVEMVEHADALRVVRWVNGRSEVDRLLKEWTLEELEGVGMRMKEEGQKEAEKRKKRIEELKKDLDKKSKRKLMVEFSIENAQTVKKRLERREKVKEREEQKQHMKDEEEEVSRREEETRRNRVEDLKRLESAKEVEQRMGRLIGKKRKFRREKQKGGGGGGGRKG